MNNKKALQDALKGLSTMMPVEIPGSQLKYDGSYQRPVNEKRVAVMAASFNPVMFDAIIVSKRDDGFYYVVDGQHRIAMLRTVFAGRDVLVPCRVVEGLTREQEAALYLALSIGQRPLTAHQRYFGALVAKASDAVAVDASVKRIGRNVGKSSCDGKKEISCVETLYKIHAWNVLDDTLAIADAWALATKDESSFSSSILKLIGTFLRRVPGVNVSRAGKAFASIRPSAIEAQLNHVVGMSTDAVATTTLVELYNRGLRSHRVAPAGQNA